MLIKPVAAFFLTLTLSLPIYADNSQDAEFTVVLRPAVKGPRPAKNPTRKIRNAKKVAPLKENKPATTVLNTNPTKQPQQLKDSEVLALDSKAAANLDSKDPSAPSLAPTTTPLPEVTTTTAPISTETAAKPKIATTSTATSSPPNALAVSTKKIESIAGEKSLRWLKNGNTRYRKGFLRADGQSPKDRARLAETQKPHAIIFAPSDSRVPPEIIFDQKLGEIYVIRSLNLSVNPDTVASIDHAVTALGARHLVFMKVAQSKALPASWANIEEASTATLENSQILRDAVTSGDVKVSKAMYHLDSGLVDWKE